MLNHDRICRGVRQIITLILLDTAKYSLHRHLAEERRDWAGRVGRNLDLKKNIYIVFVILADLLA